MATTGGSSRLVTTFFQTVAPGAVASYNIPASLSQALAYTNGTGAKSYDQLHSKIYNLAAASQDIDLTSLLDVAGNSINMARAREVFVFMLAKTAGRILTVDTTLSNGWKPAIGDGSSGGKIRLFAQASDASVFDYFHWSDWYSTGAGVGGVTGSTSRLVRLNPGSDTFDAWVVALGCSAVS